MVCCLPTCAQGCSFPVMGDFCVWFGIFFLVSSWCLVHMGSFGFAELPVVHINLGYFGVPPSGHALWAEVGWGITFVTSGKNT